jgi:hypothetical protein
VIPTGAGQSRRLEGQGLSYTRARCLADGKRIIVSAHEPGRLARLFIHDLSATGQAPITPEGAGLFVVSPNDSTVAVRVRNRHPGSTTSTTSRRASRIGLSGTESPVSWTKDGLLVIRCGDPTTTAGAVTLVDPKTGRQSLWRDVWPRDRAGLLVMGTLRATPDGTAYAYNWFRALSNLYVAEGLD